MEEKKLKKMNSTWLKVTKPLLFFLSYCNLHLFQYFLFFIFYFISLFTPFLLFMILFSAFYSWTMLEMLQILLLISYKLACHQSQKIISNIYSLYFLSNTNHILTPSIYKFSSSYMNWLFCLLILIIWNIFIFAYNCLFILLLLLVNIF